MPAPLAEMPAIHLLVAGHVHCGPNWASGGRIFNDPFARLYWIPSGEGLVRHAETGQEWHLMPGRLSLIPARHPAIYTCPEQMNMFYCHLTATLFGQLDWITASGCPLELDLPEPEWARIQAMWGKLLAAWTLATPAGRLEAEGWLRLLLALPLATGNAPDAPELGHRLTQLRPALDYMQQHRDRHPTLAELAALVHLQPTYFSNLFTRCLGESPMAYLLRRRIEHAQGLLRSTDLPLKQVAAQAGFSDVYYFSRQFRRLVGTPPGAFRRLPPAP